VNNVLEAIRAALPNAVVEPVNNPGPSAQHSLLVDRKDGRAVAEFLRDSPGFDFCSNVSGVDWPPRKVKETVVTKEMVDGVEKEVKTTVERDAPGYLEVVYHLYSISKKTGPAILRMRTGDRDADVSVPSLTPVWKSADFQEREVFDLFGVRFDGHPDLRRILMWDEFADHPMRKDYTAPDDFEYEPTPHDEILAKVKARTEAA
jgi:NADH-quinone oxidoreductase subunit C